VVEVQVVSVLSHTWSQVERTIKYKRDAYTPLSPTEQRILKGLRELLESGDLLLEELYEHQRQNTHVFEDDYELGSWLWKNIPKDSPLCMGVYERYLVGACSSSLVNCMSRRQYRHQILKFGC
jgi:hypothetical protein